MFEEEKDVVEVTAFQESYSDQQLEIKTKLDVMHDIEIEDCNVIINLSSGGMVKGKNHTIRFTDSNILFRGCSKNIAFALESCNLEMDNCKIIQNGYVGDSYTIFFQIYGDARIEIDSCSFSNLQGRVIQSHGASFFMDNSHVSDLVGEFCTVVGLRDKRNNELRPSLDIQNSSFENCTIKDEIDYIKKTHSNVGSDGFYDNYDLHGENDPELIVGEDTISANMDNVKFSKCGIRCLRVDSLRFTPLCRIQNCKFSNCYQGKGLDADDITAKYPYSLSFRKQELVIENCDFDHIDGVYTHCDYSPCSIKKCRFNSCGSKRIKAHQEGILYIFNEVDEPIIDVIDCIFKKCKLKGEFEHTDNDNGVIIIRAGEPTRKQRESVLIKNCQFDDCECEQDINGKEKQDGFFGSTIKFYKTEN